MKAPQRMMVKLWKLRDPMRWFAPTLVTVSIDYVLLYLQNDRIVPYWGPFVIDGQVWPLLPIARRRLERLLGSKS